MRKVVFLFGRFQVPTKGHEEMIRFGFNYAKRIGADFRVYTSKSQDPIKNPLPYHDKIRFLHQLFPGINIVDDPNVKTAFDICRQLSDAGVEDVTMVVGGDRVAEFQNAIGKYVRPRGPGFDPRKNFAFKNFQVINSGARKAGVSGTQMRQYIKAGKFSEFLKTAPTTNKVLARQIFAAARSHLKEELGDVKPGMSRKEFDKALHSFVDFTCKQIGIKEKPSIHYKDDKGEGQPSFGGYAPGDKKLYVYTKNRHPMDIFRTVAHELIHHKQNEDGRLGKNISKEGATGSDIENEANSEAGKVMRYFGAENPLYFDMQYVKENKAIILAGTPGSGKDKILKEAILPHGFQEVGHEVVGKHVTSGNIVITGANNYDDICVIKEGLELRGYNTIMVFVNTSNEVSKQRNEARIGKGRVITETIRFAKWKDAQENLDRFDQLFERVIEVKNDLDLNLSEEIIQETYVKLIDSVSKEIAQFSKNEVDTRFENMLEEYSDFSPKPKKNPVGGAGNWGTSKLTHRYQKDTPGQAIGFNDMKVLRMENKNNNRKDKVKVFGKVPQFNDRVGPTYTSAKNPSFSGDTTADTNTFMPPEPISVMRWSMSEETKRRFKQRYGQLAEQKIKETAERLTRRESLDDPYSGGMIGATPNASFKDDVDFGGSQKKAAEQEATSLFGKRKSLNKKRNK